jgi:hypothetical protein
MTTLPQNHFMFHLLPPIHFQNSDLKKLREVLKDRVKERKTEKKNMKAQSKFEHFNFKLSQPLRENSVMIVFEAKKSPMMPQNSVESFKIFLYFS